MERAHPYIAGIGPDEAFNAAAHFPGGFVREREGEDIERICFALVNEVSDTVREHAGFSAARAGEDHDRTIRLAHGFLLFGV